MSVDNEELILDATWIKEATWLNEKVQGNDAVGRTKKESVLIPITKNEFNDIAPFLKLLGKKDYLRLDKELLGFAGLVVDKESDLKSLKPSVEKVNALYTNLKKMEITGLEPYVKKVFFALLKKEAILAEFSRNEKFLDAFEIVKDIAGQNAQLVSQEDQKYLAARLLVVAQLHKQPSCYDVSSNGRYFVICTEEDAKKSSLLEVYDLKTGLRGWSTMVEYPVQGVQFYNERQVITWGRREVLGERTSKTATLDMLELSENSQTLKNETPNLWKEMLKGAKKIWGVVLGDYKNIIGVGVDEQILLIDMASDRTCKTIPLAPSGIKRTSSLVLQFADEDRIIVELSLHGVLCFYQCDTGTYSGPEPTSRIRQYYVNGPHLITISANHDLCIWDCRQGKCIRQEKVPQNTALFVPRGRHIKGAQAQEGREIIFCDTAGQEFMKRLPVLDGSTMPHWIKLTSVGTVTIPIKSDMSYEPIVLAPKEALTSFFMSKDEGVFVAPSTTGKVYACHANNSNVNAFLTSDMPLVNNLWIQLLINQIKMGKKRGPNFDFASKPHMQKIFQTFEDDVRILLRHSFPELDKLLTDQPTDATSFRSEGSQEAATSSTSVRGGTPLSNSPRRVVAEGKPLRSSPKRTVSTSSAHADGIRKETQDALMTLGLLRGSSNEGPTDPSLGFGLLRGISHEERNSPRDHAKSILPAGMLVSSQELRTPRNDIAGSYDYAISLFKEGKFQSAYETFLTCYKQNTSVLHQVSSAYWLGLILLRASHSDLRRGSGTMSLKGSGVSYDPNAALHFFEKAALHDEKQKFDPAIRAAALVRLGEMYYYGLGVKQSYEQAFEYLKRVLTIPEVTPHNLVPALFLLYRAKRTKALNKEETHLQEVNSWRETALELCKKNADKSPLLALYEGRFLLLDATDEATYTQVEQCFFNAAGSTDPFIKAEATYRRGKLYLSMTNKVGAAHEELARAAKETLERAFEQESNGWVKAMAELYLGHLHRDEKSGKQKNTRKDALNYYEKVAAQNYNRFAQSEAAYECARIYEKESDDVPADAAKAIFYQTQALEIADRAGLKNIKAHLLREHFSQAMRYLDSDPLKAYSHFEAVLESEDQTHLDEAWFRLAEIYRKGGSGIKKQPALALEYYEKLLKYGKNGSYVHRALYVLGKEAFSKYDFKRAEDLLAQAKSRSDDPKITKKAAREFAKLPCAQSSKDKKQEDDDSE